MNKNAWLSFALAALGPVIGWWAHELYQPVGTSLSIMGMATFLSWSGFWLVVGASLVDWSEL